jgi:hypothetical protein
LANRPKLAAKMLLEIGRGQDIEIDDFLLKILHCKAEYIRNFVDAPFFTTNKFVY